MTIGIHQPNFLPWLGYFNKIKRSDIFVLLDDVEFTRGDYINRVKIKTAQTEQWLTVPILFRGHSTQLINETKINNQIDWQNKIVKTIEMNYCKAPYFQKYFPEIKNIIEKKRSLLSELNVALVNHLIKLLDIKTKMIFSSHLKINVRTTQRLTDIVKRMGGDTYLSGSKARGYQEEKVFAQNNVKLKYQNFAHPQYPQLYGEFIPGLSIVDALFNCGEEAKKLI